MLTHHHFGIYRNLRSIKDQIALSRMNECEGLDYNSLQDDKLKLLFRLIKQGLLPLCAAPVGF